MWSTAETVRVRWPSTCLVVVMLASGCASPTTLFVEVEPPTGVTISALTVAVQLEDRSTITTEDLPRAGGAPQLPGAFVVELPDGPTTVSVVLDAMDVNDDTMTSTSTVVCAPHRRTMADLVLGATAADAMPGAVGAGVAATPTSITLGQSAVVSWTTLSATSADLNGEAVPLNATRTVSPTTTTTYRVTATNASGATDWGEATITVQ